MAGSSENTFEGITAEKVDLTPEEKKMELQKAKSTKTPRGLFSAKREDVLEEAQDTHITAYLQHTWKPTPYHLHMFLLGAKLGKDFPGGWYG